MNLVCLGELLIDMFPAEMGRRLVDVTAFSPKPGGAPGNVAVAAARLGAQSAFMGKVGDDVFGHYLAGVLQNAGVTTRGIRFDTHARTTLAFIAMPDANTSEFVFYRNPGADMLLTPEELDRSLLQNAHAFHFGSPSLSDEPVRSATIEAIRMARVVGSLISFDVNYRPNMWHSREQAYKQIMAFVPQADLLKVNESEMVFVTGEDDLEAASRKILSWGPKLCVITLGAQGCYFRTATGGGYVPGFAVQTVDATGCGDAFIAGLLVSLISKGAWLDPLTLVRLRQVMRFANAVGALTSLKMGVIPALPSLDEVDRFLASRKEDPLMG